MTMLFILLLAKIRAALVEIHREVTKPPERPTDLVDASYVATRMAIKERTVLEGKAGTDAIPRVLLKADGATRPLVRFQRAAVDRHLDALAREASANTPKQRVNEFLRRRKIG